MRKNGSAGKPDRAFPVVTLPNTKANIALAKEFIWEKWQERAKELGRTAPKDTSGSCKFASMFAQRIFGGTIRGNSKHQFVKIGREIVDLSSEAADVKSLAEPYFHDRTFWGNREHRRSMESCKPLVDLWVDQFLKNLPAL